MTQIRLFNFSLRSHWVSAVTREWDRHSPPSLFETMAERDIVDAALTSISTCAGPVLQALIEDREWLANPTATDVLTAIVNQIVRQRRGEDISALTESLEPKKTAGNSLAVTKLLNSIESDTGGGARLERFAAVGETARIAGVGCGGRGERCGGSSGAPGCNSRTAIKRDWRSCVEFV